MDVATFTDSLDLTNLTVPKEKKLVSKAKTRRQKDKYKTVPEVTSLPQWATHTVGSTTLSSKVTLPHAIELRASCDANLVTKHPGIWS